MKKIPIVLLTTIFIILLSSCSSCDKDTTGPEDEEFVTLSENTIIIEETNLSEPVIDSTTYTYTFTGEPPDITEGDIIIGQTGEGYLRKVTSATITENELILETDQACFTDAIKECNIIESYEFNLGGKNGNNKFNMYTVYLAKGVSIDRGRLSLDNTVLFSGTVNNADLTVEITEGSVDFEPTLNAELEISWFEIQHLLLSASGSLEFDCDLTLNCNAAVSYSDEITIATFSSPSFMIGPVPMSLELSFVAGFETELDNPGETTSGFDSNASVEFGAEYYNESGWSTIWNNSSNINAHSIYWEMNGDVYTKGYIAPQLNLVIANVAGPYMEVETYLDFEGVINIPNWEWELAAGLNGNLGFEVEIFSFSLIDYYTTLLNWEIIIDEDNGIIQEENLIAYYPFNGNANDESGNGNNGNVCGASLTSDRFGIPNRAYYFDGIDDYIEVMHANILSPTNAISMVAWINFEVGGVLNPRIISKDQPEYTGYQLYTYTNSANRNIGIELGGPIGLSSTTSVGANSWHFIVGTYDGTNIKIYINNVLSGSTYSPGNIVQNDNSMWFGQRRYNGLDDFKESIDDIRIYNRALTESEIDALYHEGGWGE